MCDTLVIPRGLNVPHTLFAKNSDREPNEAQQVVAIPAADHGAGETLVCTYISIPEVNHTHALLLSKPFWLWGAEMGANEHGVTIGNEALFTVDSRPQHVPAENGLIGMDLLRLGLERGATAAEALDVIVSLLERWGQGGNCGYTHDFRYDNSFMIADPQETWLLETAGREWVARRVTSPRSISNIPTLATDWQRASTGILGASSTAKVDFAATRTDFERTLRGSGASRCARTQSLLDDGGEVSARRLMGSLRDHGAGAQAGGQAAWSPQNVEERMVCMHAAASPNAGSQTTGSMVSILAQERQMHFITGVAAPCTAIFLPMWIDCVLPQTRLAPTGRWDDATLFWQHEGLHRRILAAYDERMTLWQPLRDSVEAEIVAHALELQDAPRPQREHFVAACIERVYALYGEWAGAFEEELATEGEYTRFWRGLTEQAVRPTPH